MAELSREALLIYLENIRTLETISHESAKEIGVIRNKEEEEKQKYDSIVKEIPDRVPPKLPYHPIPVRGEIIMYLLLGLGGCGIGWLIKLFCGDGFFRFIGYFYMFSAVILLIYMIKLCLETYDNYVKRCKEYEIYSLRYDNIKEEYDRQCTEDAHVRENAEQNLNEFCNEAQNKISLINSDIDSIKNQLQDAYNMNIIPLPFRNIQGVYYLYDYISTSNQSLSEALMQCNLDAIKQKLDNVIDLQGKAIVQQAQANKALYEQNQKILETAISTMNNTAVAAQYARISAINSEVALKMQSKQLAYQTAEFWLDV